MDQGPPYHRWSNDIRKDIRVNIQVNGHGVSISMWMSAPSDHLHGYPYGYPCGCPCPIIRARTVRLGTPDLPVWTLRESGPRFEMLEGGLVR